MRKASTLIMASLAVAAMTAPAIAQKASGKKQADVAESRIPPGILKALEKDRPGAGHGHGDDVPRGNGNGWGHLLHDHEDVPASP